MADKKKTAKKVKPPAKKPAAKKPTAKQPAGVSIGWKGFFRMLVSAPARRIIMIVAIIVLLAVFWHSIVAAYDSLVRLFGWGLVFVIVALITLVVLIWRRRHGTLFYHWNRWLGGIAFVFAAWGIMGLIDENIGGRFGLSIVGSPPPGLAETVISILYIAGYIVLGIVLVAPRPSYRAVSAVYAWIAGRFKRPAPAPRPGLATTARRDFRPMPPISEKPPLPRVMQETPVPPEVATSRKRLEELAEKAAALKPGGVSRPAEGSPSRPDLRQVADDVWKKYGQSPNLVVVDGWRLPPIDILDMSPEVQFSQADNLQRAKLIEETLASYGVDAKVVQINAGPTVTQFGVEPGWDRKFKEIKEKDRDGNVQVRVEEIAKTRVKVERINSLSNDLALALAAPTIRIEAPVPGKSFVGVEVPNTTSDMVSLRGVVETSAFQKLLSRTKMTLALGKGAGGEAIAADLTKMPHLLIAGATGSGKTVCLNTIVCCLLMHNTPNDVRFILVDPKRVELTQYNSIPHLATPVIVDTNRALSALRWLSQEMDNRYQKLASSTSWRT
jgi:S-DNA-T family DNA segregation ATPase FtsK/SpoIIIE